jgi:hypothetical protein
MGVVVGEGVGVSRGEGLGLAGVRAPPAWEQAVHIRSESRHRALPSEALVVTRLST